MKNQVSIPFIAGQWSLPDLLARLKGEEEFQSPSLRGSGRFRPSTTAMALWWAGFNPLHCGAVVASPAFWQALHARYGFNPLHCGAVVASLVGDVSVRGVGVFQSPSLRGSGRFIYLSRYWIYPACLFQSPSLRGSGRFLIRQPR